MLDFSDQPYQFFPPKPNRFVIGLAKWLNKTFVLPGKKHRIESIELRHADRVLPVIRSTQRCVLLPNHSTHSDPQMMLEVQRRLGINAATMAAYDVFLRGKRQAWFMQSIGCFSVDRDGSDKQAMNCAVETLTSGKRALTIFPEGNVFLMNDRVAPFLGGAAFIAMRAQKKLGKDKPVYALPISLKYTHTTDCTSEIERHIGELESALSTESAADNSLRRRLRQIGLRVLSRNLRQRGFIEPVVDDDDLTNVLKSSAIQIIERLEQKIDIKPKADQPPLDRIRNIRAAIHQTRIDETKQLDHRAAHGWADEAILAFRILSYSGDYLSASPTLDRHAETLEKLREDLAEEILPPIGPRNVVVQFGDPINLAEYLGAKNSRQALSDLTASFEAAVQQGIAETIAANEFPGSTLLE